MISNTWMQSSPDFLLGGTCYELADAAKLAGNPGKEKLPRLLLLDAGWGTGQVERSIYQRNVRKCLGKVSHQALGPGVVLFGEQPNVIGQRQYPLKKLFGIGVPPLNNRARLRAILKRAAHAGYSRSKRFAGCHA